MFSDSFYLSSPRRGSRTWRTVFSTKDYAIPGSEMCVSWDFDRQNWTPQGCNTSVNHDGVIFCSCSHLTNFAVLVDICLRQEECGTSKVETALTYISYIGISASIISLILALIILLSHRRIRQKTITKYHIQLSLSLLLLFLVSLVFVILSAENITALYGGCVTVSVLVHYFALVAMMWMGAEALFMFQKLVLVFVHITTKYIIIVSVICWGLPIFFVLVPLLTDLANGSDPAQDIVINRASLPSYCFLSNVGAFWGTFLAPIIIILLFNTVIFIWVSVVLIHHAKCTASRKKETKNRNSIIRLMISIGGVMFLFGLTWLFAILTFSATGLRETFQILFTLFNSFQGFFIFLFFCAINKEARESWKEMFGSSRQSELLHTPCAISNGHSLNKSHTNKFRAQRSATDTSTVRHHDHLMTTSKFGDSRKGSWDSNNSAYKTDAFYENDSIAITTVDPGIHLHDFVAERDEKGSNEETANPISVPKQNPIQDALSMASATTESGIDPDDRPSLGEDNPAFKEGSSSPSNVAELGSAARQTDPKACINATSERNNGDTLKVCVKRYSSMIKREYDVEKIKVEFHSESSSESSNEDEC